LLLACAGPANAQQPAARPTAKGAGSTFVQPLLSAWAAVFKDETDTDIEYRPTGSGIGLTEIMSGNVDFAATDQPLSSAELAQGRLAQFPIAIGAIVPVMHLSGIKSGKLRLTGPLLADIFAGKVTRWNDAAIAKLNPGLKLPKARIAIVHRADSSGTTFNFTHYLGRVSTSWKDGPGEGQTIKWPSGIGVSGSSSLADWVKNIPNSIGYVEYAYVLTNDLTYACLQNVAGQFACPSAEAFSSAVENTNWNAARDFDLIVTNAPGERAYPIMATTFILMPRQPKDQGRADAAMKFLMYGLEKGQDEARALNYVPLPATLISQIKTYLRQH